MVRTSRSSVATTVAPASMDDIDLDVMFAADGDALFEGLDIDLDMDDITSGGGKNGTLDTSSTSNTPTYSRGVVSRPPSQTRPKSPQDINGHDGLSHTRRKTKRKAKTPAFFEDEDDDYDELPANKKKRKPNTGTTVPSKKRPTAKIKQDDASTVLVKPPAATSKSKSKSSKTASAGMPPPLARNGPWLPTSSSSGNSSNTGSQNVATVGQFGNRQKRPSGTLFPSLPKSASVAVAPNHGGRMINKLPLARSVSETSIKSKASAQSKKWTEMQIESSYCGLKPSSTHFYPFMPALPLEPVLKSRKLFGSVDRIHTSLVSYIHPHPHTTPQNSSGIVPAKEIEPLFHLLREAFKEEKVGANTSRLETIGISIAELRKTIAGMDTNQIAIDWYGVCGLLQRQHDFLKQNCENMEKWCHDNFSKEDYAEVYVPSTDNRKDNHVVAPISVLKTFTKREIKVKIASAGLKDAKMPAFAIALLPPQYLPNEIIPPEWKEIKTTTAKKKTHSVSDSAQQDGRSSDLTAQSSKLKPSQPLSYANMKPPRRRRNVAEMIARSARELSKAHSLRTETRRRTIERREVELQKYASDNTFVIHTAGMWKWIELSGFFGDVPMSEIQDRLQYVHPKHIPVSDDAVDRSTLINQPQIVSAPGEGVHANIEKETVFDRLQSLLIEIDSNDSNDIDERLEDLEIEETHEVCNVVEYVDISALTLEERSCLVLRSFGFSDLFTSDDNCIVRLHENKMRPKLLRGADTQLKNGQNRQETRNEQVCDNLDDVIATMNSELAHVEELNSGRIRHLKSVSSRYQLSKQNDQQKSDCEARLIAKYQLLMRKSKEQKAKFGATVKKDDSLALPW
jgi:hypothetical protein